MNNLKTKADLLNLNYGYLAGKADVSVPHIYYVLNGERDLSYNVAKEIYRDFGHQSPVALFLESKGYCPCQTAQMIGNSDEEKDQILNQLVFEVIKAYEKKAKPSKAKMKNFVSRMGMFYNSMRTLYERPSLLKKNQERDTKDGLYERPSLLRKRGEN